MDYQKALQYITELQKSKGSEYSLEPVRRLCELAGRPDRDLSIVHITGTNGKGSIGSYLGNIMAMSGYTVGRYVSPTLLDYRERIQKIQHGSRLLETKEDSELRHGSGMWESLLCEDKTEDIVSVRDFAGSLLCEDRTEDIVPVGDFAGSLLCEDRTEEEPGTDIVTEYITEQEVAEILTRLRSLAEQMETREGLSPTAFEIETVMAFLVMKQWNVDVAIVECGMGGKMDATNIIAAPILCLFSHIGLDHTAFLGETIEEIAVEKAGILKPGCVAVSVKQDKSVDEILHQICLKQRIPLSIADPQEAKQIRYDMQGTTFHYHDSILKIGQQGTYQIENAVVAVEAANALQGLGYDRIREHSIQNAIACSHHRGRFECICEKPYVIVDGAHNPQAAKELRHSLESYFPDEQFTYICGVFRDKDYMQMMEEMLPLTSGVYTIKPPGERGLSAELLAASIAAWRETQGKERLKHCQDPWIPVQPCGSVEEALDLAIQKSQRILVFGSLSFLHEVYEYFHVTDS